MDDQDIRLLNILGKTRNITRAADKLYISQSTISKRIKQIERELGINIVLRSRHGVHFTPEGETVLAYAQNFLDNMEKMRQQLLQKNGNVAGVLRAGISINYACYRLAEPLIAYRKKYPLVDTRIKTANSRVLFSALLDNQIDVAIIRGEYQWVGERILLEREPICLIINERDINRPLKELPQIIHYDTDMEWQIAQWMRENKIPTNKDSIAVNNTSTCLELVKNGLGWGIVPEICLNNFEGAKIPIYFANGEALMRSTYIMYNKQVLELPQIAAFIDMIKKYQEGKRNA